MILKVCKYTYLLFIITLTGFANNKSNLKNRNIKQEKDRLILSSKKIITGAEQINLYVPLLKGKNVGVVGNQTSIIPSNKKHLVDVLLENNIKVKKIFSPEHGFRGKADAGETVKDGVDNKTGLAIISIYGDNKKPKKKHLEGLDVVVFDLQDVGVRFYTYISNLHYVMEACAEQNIPLILLDRPNPNGHYIDGPVLNLKYKSFVGMHPVPIVYGMTIGEYANMINGENWLKNKVKCNLTIIPVKNYNHKMEYDLPVKPSPNLPNKTSVNLYPSLCFFEATTVSCGRGTNKQFQIYGSPYMEGKFKFTPKSNEGSKFPKHKNKVCYGENLQNHKRLSKIDLTWFLKAYKQTSRVKTKFWYQNNLFTKLAGNELLKKQIIKGLTEEEIRKTWQEDLEKFLRIRVKYLIYK